MTEFESRLAQVARQRRWPKSVVRRIHADRKALAARPEPTIRALVKALRLSDDDVMALRRLAHVPQAPRRVPARRAAFAPGALAPAAKSADSTYDPESFLELTAAAPATPAAPTAPDPDPPAAPEVDSAPPVQLRLDGHRTVHAPTLLQRIRQAHVAPSVPARDTLLEDVAALGAAVGNLHRRGRVLGNLAPDNALVGAHDAVIRDLEAAPTPAYHSPEQARGEEALTPASDVFALGSLLFEALSGRALFAAVAHEETLDAIRTNRRRELTAPWPIPTGLAAVLSRCTAADPADRYPDARVFVAALDRVLAAPASPSLNALAESAAIAELRASGVSARASATASLAQLNPHAPLEARYAAWDGLAEADANERDADAREEGLIAALHGEVASRAALAEVLHIRHRVLEAAGRDVGPVEAALRSADTGRFATYLEGDGRLSLRTEPKGALVDLYRFETKNRRLQPVFERSLGPTPITELRIGMGSFLAVLRHPDCMDVHYPVLIRRRTHWHGRPPGVSETVPIELPRKGELAEHDIHVPAGWLRCGGPAEADAMPEAWTWCDAFVIQRSPVTLAEYLTFLDDLARSRPDELASRIPRTPAGDPLVVAKGRKHHLRPDPPWPWSLDWPATFVDWGSASAYAAWHAARTEQRWRLPSELEWEKAARGVDGRTYPWGDDLDPRFAAYASSHAGRPLPTPPESHPLDRSPYGVLGMGGNVSDWCRDSWQSRISIAAGHPPPVIAPTGQKVVRGGHFAMNGPSVIASLRSPVDASARAPWLGFRLARRLTPVERSPSGPSVR